jgi:hypothetical protein
MALLKLVVTRFGFPAASLGEVILDIAIAVVA